MITRGATLIGRMAAIFAILFTFTACGGGGGSSDVGFFPDDDNNSASEIALRLFDPQGNETRTVTSSAPGTLKVSVGSGANVVVTAETDIGTVFPLSGTALTDGSGVATFQVEAGLEKGAGTITASYTNSDEEEITGTLPFQVGDSGLQIGYFDNNGMFVENEVFIEPQSTLSPGGNAQLTVVILDSDGKRVTTAEQVRFSSSCIAAGQAVLNPFNPVRSVNGEASTTYTAMGCSGADIITASLTGGAAQASGSVDIAAPSANAIEFVIAEPLSIVLRGTGSEFRDETADVVFRVVDSTGAPLAGVPVELSLTTEIGGLSLSRNSGLSNGAGEVEVTVSAGDVATTVRVLASIDLGNGEIVATVSDLLTVTTGLPDQDSITLGVAGGFIIENGFTTNGICRTVTVKMNDKFQNPVVDGTAAVFTTEYGDIDGACTTGISNGDREGGTPETGECSVLWCSGNPRLPGEKSGPAAAEIQLANLVTTTSPVPQDLSFTRGGRSTILVRAQGEESFTDRNGNGVMDQEEKDLFKNVPEAFIDNNEDGAYTVELASCIADPLGSRQCIAGYEETFFDYNDNGVYDLNDDPAWYNGLLCPPEGDGVWCSRELIEVRADTVVTLSADPDWYFNISGSGGSYTVFVGDIFNNPPPEGSTVTLAGKDGCTILSEATSTVGNLPGPGAFGPVEVFTADGGTVTITFSPIGGQPISATRSCTPIPPPPDPNDPT